MRRVYILLVTGIVINITSAFAQTEPDKIINEFFNKYENKDISEAINYIFSTNKWMGNSKKQIDELKIKLKQNTDLMGEYHGHQYIIKNSIGESLISFSYLVKYDLQPLRFTFIFYKPDKEWMLYNFKYDDKLTDDLEEAARAYRLKENLPQH